MIELGEMQPLSRLGKEVGAVANCAAIAVCLKSQGMTRIRGAKNRVDEDERMI
jgi:hypothetical protein